ncbi:MAG: hypothetical protein H6611_00920 [Ignavibacteriales bacterium]|nr:hypothetical protein [Ignavibacteriales bacterium]
MPWIDHNLTQQRNRLDNGRRNLIKNDATNILESTISILLQDGRILFESWGWWIYTHFITPLIDIIYPLNTEIITNYENLNRFG